jgi:predicted DNA-binding ribbon-helix-helix protein
MKKSTTRHGVLIALRIPRQLKDDLEKLATAEDRTLSSLIRFTLTKLVEERKGKRD